MNRLAHKKILITGASQGLGRQLALDFAREGAAALALCARHLEPLEKVRDELVSLAPNVHVVLVEADLGRPADIERLFAIALHEFRGRLDVLVNNASILGPLPCRICTVSEVTGTSLMVGVVGDSSSGIDTVPISARSSLAAGLTAAVTLFPAVEVRRVPPVGSLADKGLQADLSVSKWMSRFSACTGRETSAGFYPYNSSKKGLTPDPRRHRAECARSNRRKLGARSQS